MSELDAVQTPLDALIDEHQREIDAFAVPLRKFVARVYGPPCPVDDECPICRANNAVALLTTNLYTIPAMERGDHNESYACQKKFVNVARRNPALPRSYRP